MRFEFKTLTSLAIMVGLSGVALAQEKKPAKPSSHICYFSMNNGKEFPELEKFLTQLNKVSPDLKITVAEYQTEGSNPEESFRMMLRDLKAEGRHCDGLVLSGHHTGSFSGQRASGTLGVEFLESLSCEPANREFFSKIQSVWLQGCRTMGTCKVAFGTDADRAQFGQQVQAAAQAPIRDPGTCNLPTARSPVASAPIATAAPAQSADFHTERVGAVLAEDHLTQSYAQLNTEFSATLDQDNPLSTRYLRIFPRAAVFGWTATAPGPIARSEYSLPYHIAHTTKHMDDRKELFQNPRDVLSENSARAYGKTLTGMLNRDHAELSKGCVGDACQKGWMDQASSKTMGFGTNEANALPPLMSGSSAALLRAKNLECEIKSPSSPEAHAKALRDILEDPTQVAYNFNSLWELLQKAEKEGDEKKLKELRDQYGKSIHLANFLNRKFQDPTLGTLRKIDYYAFYRDMMGKKNDVIEGRILQAAKAVIMKEAKGYDQRDYQQTMIQSLAKNKLLNDGFVEDIMGGPDAHPDSKIEFLSQISSENYTPTKSMYQSLIADPRATEKTFEKLLDNVDWQEIPEKQAIFDQIMADKRTTGATLGMIAQALPYSDESTPESDKLFRSLVIDPRATAETFDRILSKMTYYDKKVPQQQEILKQIMTDKRSTADTLASVARSVGYSENSLSEAEQILTKIVADPRSNADTLSSVAASLDVDTQIYPNKVELLRRLLVDKRSDSDTLVGITTAIKNSKDAIHGAQEFLQKIITDPRGDEDLPNAVAAAVGESKHHLPNSESLLKQVLSHKSSSEDTLSSVASAIGDSMHAIPNSEKFLNQIIADKRFARNPLSDVAKAIGKSRHPIPGARKILESIMADKRISGDVLNATLSSLGETQQAIENPDELLRQAIQHKAANDYTLNYAASAVGSTKLPLADPKGLLTKIMRDPRSDGGSLGSIVEALGTTSQNIPEADAMLKSLMKDPRAHAWTQVSYMAALGSGRFSSINAEEEFNRYIANPDSQAPGLTHIATALTNGKLKIQAPEQLLERAIRHPNHYYFSLDMIKEALETSKTPLEGRERLIKLIEDHPVYREGPPSSC